MGLGQIVNKVLAPVGLRLVRASWIDELHGVLAAQPLLTNVWGHRMHVDPADQGLPLWPLIGKQPGGEDRYFIRNLRPGQRVVDVGANVGLYTLLFAKLVGETGSVIAFEPGPKSFDLLSRNIAENGYRSIEANHAAVGERTGEIDLFVCRTGESDNRVAGTLTDADARDRTTVRCVTLDDGVGGRPVDLIKMDVQGAEFMALKGAQATLRNNQNLQMVVEYSPGGIAITGASPAEFLGFIESFGLKFFMLDDQGDAHAVSRSWLLDNIGGANRRQQANILVKR